MLRNYSIVTLVLLLVACLTYVRHVAGELTTSRAREKAAALRTSNIEARHDTTRSIGVVSDSLHAFARRVVQVAQPKNQAAQYLIGAAIDTLDATITAPTRDTIPFHIRDEPFTVDAVVTRKSDADSTSLTLHVALDTVRLVARIECAPGHDAAIRAASIMTTAPPWAAVRLGEVQQAVEVCNARIAEPITRRRFISWAPIALSVGRQIGSGAQGGSAQIGTALTLGAR